MEMKEYEEWKNVWKKQEKQDWDWVIWKSEIAEMLA